MFRKPKRLAKSSLRTNTRQSDDGAIIDEAKEAETTSRLIKEAKEANSKKRKTSADEDNHNPLMQEYKVATDKAPSASELATSTAQHHPSELLRIAGNDARPEEKQDGIFRNKERNKFLAGPIKASAFVRTTSRFDYQPDICKDYKDTGFCGFGDTCIYLHDRGDSLSGWQLEQQWEEQKKKEAAQRELDLFSGRDTAKHEALPDDGLPFACYLCREAFTDPAVTACGHYFCEKCIMDFTRQHDKGTCPICKKDTHGVFNQPTKLIAKKRRLIGASSSWLEFLEASKKKNINSDDDL
jgi:RING finger protein 113A